MLRVLPHTHKPVLRQIRLLTGLKQGGNAIHWSESYDSCGRKKQLVTTVSSLEQCASKRNHHRGPY